MWPNKIPEQITENKMSGYKKTFEDEVDWKIIDQLHNATNKFSASSLEFKKIYFVLLGIVIPIIFKIGGEKFDIALLVTPLIISLFFWFLDSFTYYYQEVLREKMDKHFEKLRKRNPPIGLEESDNDEYTLNNNRTSENRICRSVFNSSSAFYPSIIGLNLILIIFHYAGAFNKM